MSTASFGARHTQSPSRLSVHIAECCRHMRSVYRYTANIQLCSLQQGKHHYGSRDKNLRTALITLAIAPGLIAKSSSESMSLPLLRQRTRKRRSRTKMMLHSRSRSQSW